jgi:alpha-amylase
MKNHTFKALWTALLGISMASSMGTAQAAFNPANTSVQMFHWKWNDIAKECTNWLGPKGYGAVQISPPGSSAVLGAWYDLYQPVDFTNLNSRMGTTAELQSMINTCHTAGVRVYADVVPNHVAAAGSVSSANVGYNPGALSYPRFGSANFHPACDIVQSDYNGTASGGNRSHVTQCRLVNLPDLDTGSTYVQGELRNYFNVLLNMGIDGFRIDAAKHIVPTEVAAMLSGVSRTTKAGEALWLSQEVIPDGNVVRSDYFTVGGLNEFQYTYLMRYMFRGESGGSLSQVQTYMGVPGNWGGTWGFIDSSKASVFVTNWDTERNGDGLNSNNNTGSYPNDTNGTKRYDLANIFMLAWPYGHAQVYTGFKFSNRDADRPSSSPFDASGNPQINVNWDFSHRWGDIANMVAFRNTTNGAGVSNFVSGTPQQIAFNRGNLGFVAINNDSTAWNLSYSTGLPAGTYCNVAHGVANAGKTACAADSVVVAANGSISVSIPANGGTTVPAVALHVNQKISSGGGTCTSVPVTFRVANANTVPGQNVYVAGNRAELGNWTASTVNLLNIEGSGANVPWSRTINLPPSTAIQFKFMKSGAVANVWERNQATTSGNREATTVSCGSSQTIDVGNFAF